MTAIEIDFIKAIRESPDPTKSMSMAIDVLTRMLTGESWESICIDYSIDPEEVKKRMVAPC